MKKYLLLFGSLFLGGVAYGATANDVTVMGRVVTQKLEVSTVTRVSVIDFIDGSSQTTAGFIRIKDEGTYFMSGSTINCVGAGITCSDAGNGVTQIQVTATGGGGGASSLSVGKGSIQKYLEVSSPTSHISVSTNGLNATLISPTTAFISVDYSTWDATYLKVVDWNVDKATRTSGGGSSDNFGAHFATQPANFQSITASSGVFRSSLSVFGVVTSSSGFIGAGSSFTSISLPPSGATHDATLNFGSPDTGMFQWPGSSSEIDFKAGKKDVFYIFSNVLQGSEHVYFLTSRSSGPYAVNYAVGSGDTAGIYKLSSGLDAVGIAFSNTPMVEFPGYSNFFSSIAARNVITSTVGFIANSSTFAWVNVSGGSITLNGVQLVWTPVAPSNAQVPTYNSSNGLIEWKTPSAGGAGGGGGGAIYDGSQTLAISSFAFPGGTITYDGVAGASVTFIPAIRSTWTAFIAFASTAQAVGISTQNIQTFFAGFTSTSDARGNTFVNFRSTTDAALTAFVNFRSTTDTALSVIRSTAAFLFAYTSTADARGDTFVNFRSTSDTLFNTLISTMMEVRKDTGNIVNELSTRTLVLSGNPNITAVIQGANISLSQSGSSLTIAGSGGAGPISASDWNIHRTTADAFDAQVIYRRYAWNAESLVAVSSDFAHVIATNSVGSGGQPLLPELVRFFSEAATTTARTKLMTSRYAISASSPIYIGYVWRGGTVAANSNVQWITRSTGTTNGWGSLYNTHLSTGVDFCPSPSVNGQYKMCVTSVSPGTWGLQPNSFYHIDWIRGHDTAKLGTTDLKSPVYGEMFFIDVPELITNMADLQNSP